MLRARPVRSGLTSVTALALAAALHVGARHPGEPGGWGGVTEEPGGQLTQPDAEKQTKHAARTRHLAVCLVRAAGAHALGSTSERYEDGGGTHGWMLPATSFHSYEREAGAGPSRGSDGGVGGTNDALAVPKNCDEVNTMWIFCRKRIVSFYSRNKISLAIAMKT